MRKPIVAGNWKMHKTVVEALDLVEDIKTDLADCREVDVVLCPPFTALKSVSDAVTDTHVDVGAQHMYWEKEGAYTGEISAAMLRELYCHYVIIGHSERRIYFHETDERVNKNVRAAIDANLHPIVCVGETLEERESSKTDKVVARQIQKGLASIEKEALSQIIVAYEPVWAIGTGKTATPEQAQEVHALIRRELGKLADQPTAQAVRIQYGGSVKPANAKDLFQQPDIDGGLIGGASLDARSFVEIVQAAFVNGN